MKISVNYGKCVVAIPGKAIEQLNKADETDLRVLLSVCADSAMTDKARAKALGIDEASLKASFKLWRGMGILSDGRDEAAADTSSTDADDEGNAPKPKKRVLKNPGLPKYSTEELTASLSKEGRKSLLEHCQQCFGRVFNASEAEIVIGICDYMNVTTDYVALLCSHLAAEKKGLMSIRILENTAQVLYDRGICDTASLISYFEVREKANSLSGKIRSLFGFGTRAFTPSEELMLEKWAGADFEDGMLEYAYELTVNGTGGVPHMKYLDKIIDSWIAEGFKTLAEVKAKQDEFEKKKQPRKRKQTAPTNVPSESSSFSTDDFFESALLRSYEGMEAPSAASDNKGGE